MKAKSRNAKLCKKLRLRNVTSQEPLGRDHEGTYSFSYNPRWPQNHENVSHLQATTYSVTVDWRSAVFPGLLRTTTGVPPRLIEKLLRNRRTNLYGRYLRIPLIGLVKAMT